MPSLLLRRIPVLHLHRCPLRIPHLHSQSLLPPPHIPIHQPILPQTLAGRLKAEDEA